jgi:hypothetical protein
LESGRILICDENNNRAIEVTRDGDIVWQYGNGDPSINDPVSGVAFASRLKDGHTLITDSNRAPTSWRSTAGRTSYGNRRPASSAKQLAEER